MTRLIIDSEKYYTEKAKLPEPNGITCVICGGDLPRSRIKYCSDECFSNWYNSLNHDWNVIRQKVIKRDNKCVDCNKPYDRELLYGFAVHHITPISLGGAEFDLNNCVLLCSNCHKIRHKRRYFDGSQKTIRSFI